MFTKTKPESQKPDNRLARLTAAERKQIAKAINTAHGGDRKRPAAAQQSIPYLQMFPDGMCRATETFYTKTIQFFDINYQLAQNEDKTAMFEGWCDFLNFIDSSLRYQFSFVNQTIDMEDFEKQIDIPLQEDGHNDIRQEIIDILKVQLSKGNNAVAKIKYLTFGIEADNIRLAKTRLERVELVSTSVIKCKKKGIKKCMIVAVV